MDFKEFDELYPKEKNVEEYLYDQSKQWEKDRSFRDAAQNLN